MNVAPLNEPFASVVVADNVTAEPAKVADTVELAGNPEPDIDTDDPTAPDVGVNVINRALTVTGLLLAADVQVRHTTVTL